MRHSILAMLVAFGTTITMSATAQQPSTAQQQMAPSQETAQQPSTAQQQMAPSQETTQQQIAPGQEMQNDADKGIKTRNSGESGYVAEQEKSGASAHPPGQPNSNQTTTGSNSGTSSAGNSATGDKPRK